MAQTTAAGSYAVVVCQVDIEDKLAFNGLKSSLRHCQVIFRWDVENGADVDFVGLLLYHSRFHFCCVVEAVVSDVDVIFTNEKGQDLINDRE